MPCLTTYFLEVSACVSLKAANSGPLRDRKASKTIFLRSYCETKNRRSATKVIYVFRRTLTFIPCSPTYLLQVSAQVSLKVATNLLFREKKVLKI